MHCAIFKKPFTVSFTNNRSLVGIISPSLISSAPFNNCVMIVGITALADCLGPNVLKGLTIVMGRSNDLKNESAIASAPIFEAE